MKAVGRARKSGAHALLLIAACSSLLPLHGCKVDQQREVQTYRAVLDAGLSEDAQRGNFMNASLAAAGDPASAADKPLTLTDVLLLANANSERLEIAGEDYLQSIINRRRAAAAFLPTITLAPSYALHDRTSRGGGEDGDGSSGGRDRSTFDVPVHADMFVSPVSDLAALRTAAADIDTARALLRDAQDNLLIDVARAFYEILRAEQAVEVLSNSLRVQEARVRDAQGRAQAGVVRPLDVSLSEAQAAQTRVDLVEAQNDVRNARTLLAFLVAGPAEFNIADRVLLDTLEPPESIEPLDVYLALADAHRQDVLAAAAAITAAGHAVESAYGQYFPAVSLNLSYFLSRESQPTDLDWTALIGVSLPLFSAGLIEADVRQALSELRQAKSRYSLLRRQAASDVRTAYSNLLASRQRVNELSIRVQAAAEALRQAEGLYSVGLATNLERLTAQDQLLSAELDLTNALLDQKVFYLDLLRTAGVLHQQIGLIRTPSPERQEIADTAAPNAPAIVVGGINPSQPIAEHQN